MAGGGVHGRVVGIAHGIITGVGVIMAMFQVFIMMWILAGEDTTGNAIGTGTRGTMNGLITDDFNGTGRRGIAIDIGKDNKPGASRIINLDHNSRGKS